MRLAALHDSLPLIPDKRLFSKHSCFGPPATPPRDPLMSKTYYEMLLDPRWQRKRLEILQAADFRCVDCGSAEKTLHVHHMYYEKGRKPWEYEIWTLRCLCEDCHLSVQETQADIARAIADMYTHDLTIVRGFIESINALRTLERGNPTVAIPVVGPGDTTEYDQGVAMGLGITKDRLYELAKDGKLILSRDVLERQE